MPNFRPGYEPERSQSRLRASSTPDLHTQPRFPNSGFKPKAGGNSGGRRGTSNRKWNRGSIRKSQGRLVRSPIRMTPLQRVSPEVNTVSSGSSVESELVNKVKKVRERVVECKEVFRSSLNDVAGMREELVGLERVLKDAFEGVGGDPLSPVRAGMNLEASTSGTPTLVRPKSPQVPTTPLRRSPRLSGKEPATGTDPEARSVFLLNPELARKRRRHLGVDHFCSTSAQRLCTRILTFLDGHFPLEVSVSELNEKARNLSDARFQKIDASVASLVFKMLRKMSRHPGGASSPDAFSAGLEVPRGISPLDWHMWSVRGALEYK